MLPALALIAALYADLRAAAREEVQSSALRLARSAVAAQREQVESARQLLTALAQVPAVRNSTSRECSVLMTDLTQAYADYALYAVADRDGTIWCSGLPQAVSVSIADRSYFRLAVDTRGFAVGEYQIGRITGKATVNFGYPALDAWGDVSGVVCRRSTLAIRSSEAATRWTGSSLQRWI